MCQTAANLVEHVLPAVPLRQWVLTLPHELRGRLGFDGKVLGAVARIFVDSILGWYRRRLRAGTHERVEGGAVVAVQRASSDLKLNPHLHVVFLDGVYTAAPSGNLEFRALSRLSTTDVADALQVARARILAHLERRGVIHIDADADVLRVDDALAEREPALAQLAAAAVSGLAPAGPELRRRPVELAFDGRPGVVITAPLSVRELGFSLHAATRAGADDEKGREALLKYILRPPLASERLLPGPDGLVRIALKRPFSDGTVAIGLDPLSLLCRLAATVPPPRFHTIRYAGVLASASKWRPLIVPKPAPSADHDHAHPGAADLCRPPPPCHTTGSRYRPWAELLKRTFGIDVETCPRCGGRMRLIALITEPPNVARFLRHLGEPTEPPLRATARDPPFWQSRVLRRRHHERSAQMGLFEEH
jgi:putative transposase